MFVGRSSSDGVSSPSGAVPGIGVTPSGEESGRGVPGAGCISSGEESGRGAPGVVSILFSGRVLSSEGVLSSIVDSSGDVVV